jgi:tetratricopeptide (TPR) repeat protein
MKRASQPFGGVDVLIVTTAKGDDEAVRAVDQGARGGWEATPKFAGLEWTVWTRTYASLRDEPLRVLLAPAPATGFDALSQLLDFCQPQCLALCGACTGRPGFTELGDVIIADLVYRYEASEEGRDGTRVLRPELTGYQIPTAWKYAASQLDVASDAGWARNQSRSEEEQRQWLLGELGAGRDPLAAPDWEQQCPQWDKVLESLWASGLLESDLVELSPKGMQAAKRLASLPPKEVALASVPHVHVAALAAASSLRKSERIWEELADRQRLVSGLDLDVSVARFVDWAPQRMHVVVKGVMDLGEPGRKQRSRALATRAAAEVLLELLRTVLVPAGPSAQDLLSGNLSAQMGRDNPGGLLAARYAVVPFHDFGRQRELDVLETWCASDEALAARVIVGPPGAGKTRLLMEWTKQLRSRGWAAGFLGEAATPTDIDTILDESGPVLVVVDDAADRRGLVDSMARMLGGPHAPPKLRVVLLEREAGDWWDSLRQLDSTVGTLLGTYEPLRLELGPEERVEVFRAAAGAYAQRLVRPLPDDPTVDLRAPWIDGILGVHMAALGDVLELGVSSEKLLEGLLGYEIRAWGTVCKIPGAEAEESLISAERFAAAVTLLGGVSTLEQAEALRERVKGPRHTRFVEGFAGVFPGVPPERAAIGPVEPDLLGEALVAGLLARETDPSGYLATVFAGADDAALQHGFTVLGRVAARLPNDGQSIEATRQWVRATIGADLEARTAPALRAALALGDQDAAGIVAPVLSDMLEASDLGVLAAQVGPLVPERSRPLRRIAVWALRALLGEPLSKEERARVLRDLGDRLAQLGHREDALDTTRQASEVYRQLASTDPDQFAAELGRSLHQLGLRLSEIGEWQAAVDAAQEGTELYRDLDADDPETYRPYLAAGLGDLGRLLCGTGQREAALGATQEGAELYRKLAEAQPDTYSSCLATSLADLGLRRSELGQREGAVAAIQEAAAIRRGLATVWPEAFLPELATSLNNLGKLLTDLGQRGAAVQATEEAIGIRRHLAQSRPEVFLPALAVSLNNLGANLRRMGQREAALEALSEAVTLYEQLVARQPAAYESKLMIARKNLRNLVEGAGASSAPPAPLSSPPDPSGA